MSRYLFVLIISLKFIVQSQTIEIDLPLCSAAINRNEPVTYIQFGNARVDVDGKPKKKFSSSYGIRSKQYQASWIDWYIKEDAIIPIQRTASSLVRVLNLSFIGIDSAVIFNTNYRMLKYKCKKGYYFICYIDQPNLIQAVLFIYSRKEKEITLTRFEMDMNAIFKQPLNPITAALDK